MRCLADDLIGLGIKSSASLINEDLTLVSEVQIGGWGAELNREIVSCRACVRVVCMSSEIGVKIYGRPLSLFPFGRGRFFLFLSPAPQSPIQLQLALSDNIMSLGIKSFATEGVGSKHIKFQGFWSQYS